MKILVVDDEKLLVKGIKFNLENEGYQVDACYDGEAAVEMARTGDYAVILLDLMMPKLDGLEACQKIRQFSTVPIIMLTARSAKFFGTHKSVQLVRRKLVQLIGVGGELFVNFLGKAVGQMLPDQSILHRRFSLLRAPVRGAAVIVRA